MLGFELGPAAERTIPLSDETTLDDAERDRVAARLRDMRQTLGGRDFDQLIAQARAELQALSEQESPWSAAVAQRGLSAAMLLGFDRFEIACRTVVEQPDSDISSACQNAARAAARALSDLI